MKHRVKHRPLPGICAFLFTAASALSANLPSRIGTAYFEGSGKIQAGPHGDERFVMCSTFKFLAVAAVLHRVDQGEEKLDRFIKYSERDLLEWAPITKQHLPEGGMTLEALCAAAISYSDNTAANLILQILGGPAGVTSYARSIGDHLTRLDRTEPELNRTTPGDPRDTTTPKAMLGDMQKILLGDALSRSSRESLESWMTQNTTGHAMIRASLPKDWRIGDKTGSNATANTNDIAVIRPPTGPPRLLCIFAELPGASAGARAQAIADEAGKLLAPATNRSQANGQ